MIGLSQRIYNLIVRCYPRHYREAFGEEMRYVFSASLEDAYHQYGQVGVLRVWFRTVRDAGSSLVVQHMDNLQGVDVMETNHNSIIMQNRIFGWIAGATALVLLMFFLAMQVSSEVVWTLADFVTAGILLMGAGSVFVVAARLLPRHRLVVGAVVGIALFYLWAELAVGIFTNWGS